MYRPGHDMRCTGSDTDKEIELKKLLINEFGKISDYSKLGDCKEEFKSIVKLEKKLHNITKIKVEEYSRNIERIRTSDNTQFAKYNSNDSCKDQQE